MWLCMRRSLVVIAVVVVVWSVGWNCLHCEAKILHHFIFATTLSNLSLFEYLLVHIYPNKCVTNDIKIIDLLWRVFLYCLVIYSIRSRVITNVGMLHKLKCHHCCLENLYKTSYIVLLPHVFPFLLFSFFHWLYLFSSFVHPSPFYQNSPTPFPGWRS